MGQSRRFGDVCDTSALPPTTAVILQCRERQLRANNGLMQCSKKGSLFITSSASASSDGGTVSPEYIGRHVVYDWLEPIACTTDSSACFVRIGLINQDKRGCGDDTANM